MAGLFPIQLGIATNKHAGPLASPTGEGELVTGFAAVLLGVFNLGTGPKALPEAVKPADASYIEPGNGLDTPASTAIKSSDPQPVNLENGSDTPQSAAAKSPVPGPVNDGDGSEILPSTTVKSFGSKLVQPVAGALTTAPIGDRPDASPINGVAQSHRGAGMPQPGPVDLPGDDAGLDLGSPGLDESPKASPEDATPVAGLLSEASIVLPLGNPKDAGPHGETTAPLLPVVASGKNRDGGGGTAIKAHRLSDETPVPAVQADVSQIVPVSAPTAVAVALQPPAGIVDMPTTVLPRLPDKVVASASQIKVGDDGKPANSPRPAPADPGKAQPNSADHPGGAASPAAVVPTTAEPEKIVARSNALPETPVLTIRAEVLQTSPSGTAPSAVSQTGQTQPATPADQIAPVLVGILQKPDGQQSVTVRLQPAELGQVQIRVDHSVAGVAHIAITADRPETLQLLQRDEPRLQQVLDQSGVQSNGRTVSFQVSAQDQIGATASQPESMQTGTGASGQGQNGGAWRQNGDAPNDFGRSPDPDQGQNRPRWFRAGLDITA